MCTLTFIPRKNGYVVAMNRDERLTRVEALPPRVFEFMRTKAVFPHEPSGGTWIGTNQHGVTLALLNRSEGSGMKRRSRGEIIPALISRPTLEEVEWSIEGIDKRGMLPFRLIAIFGYEKRISEWRWEGSNLAMLSFDWHARHWFSSGISDEQAQQLRAPVCHRAWQQRSAGSLAWLRRLHRSHQPDAGAFSVCVHRPDASTRSYTEIVVRPREATMLYRPVSPCLAGGVVGFTRLPVLPPETFANLASLMSSEDSDARKSHCCNRS